MKQSYLRAAVCSALLAFSGLASANIIGFAGEADKIMAAELAPLYASFDKEYTDPNWSYTNWTYFPAYVAQALPAYADSARNYNFPENWYISRPVALTELSNSEVSFTNTNLGIYTEKINPRNDSGYDSGSFQFSYSNLASFGQNGFTAEFSKPVTSVSMNFKLNDYIYDAYNTNWDFNPYESEIYSSMPTILNAVYKDAAGNVIGSLSSSTPFSMSLINGSSQLNNPSFTFGNSNPFSSVDISWDSGSVEVDNGYKDGGWYYPVRGNLSNLLTADYLAYTHAVAVPEPETYAMMMVGLGMLGFTARRKKANHLLSKRS